MTLLHYPLTSFYTLVPKGYLFIPVYLRDSHYVQIWIALILLLHLLTCIFPAYFTAMSSPLALMILSPKFSFRINLIPDSCGVESHVIPLSEIITFLYLSSFRSLVNFKFLIAPTVMQMYSVAYFSFTLWVINDSSTLFLDFQPSGLFLEFAASSHKYFPIWTLIPHPWQVTLNLGPSPPPPLPWLPPLPGPPWPCVVLLRVYIHSKEQCTFLLN